ncbi:hypothetical protein L202_06889 [Cryptococcus amylolentus CBS 6039]|uniref:Uncharacterized protein n=1 Tax=Cryptococcus amylolentus CBS 6039 TaxID=1295533 RepID=A0A1E3HDU7_9TREE|nr:hypothetical protein L202_06889 [Cryptococcus amylolentus CBS 6039]ODN74513.1 hypothetical protein L202_06889 [Cryptococcus amylolentus CBS 6039]
MSAQPSASAPLFFSYSPRTQLILHSSLTSAQLFAFLAPPAFLVSSLALKRTSFSIRGLMRYSASGAALGAVAGAGVGGARAGSASDLEVNAKLGQMSLDETLVRRNDYATIGAALSALLTPAIFLKRAPLPALVLGGASVGLGLGAAGYYIEGATKGEPKAV